jgi:hypothetical protein
VSAISSKTNNNGANRILQTSIDDLDFSALKKQFFVRKTQNVLEEQIHCSFCITLEHTENWM